MDTCLIETCDKPSEVRGYCKTCYYRLRARGELEVIKPFEDRKHFLTEINEAERTAVCQECGPVKLAKRSKNSWRCASASKARVRDYKRDKRSKRRSILLDACEICGRSNGLCYDHDHDAGHFRGTLCKQCNVVLGLMEDDCNRLQNAIDYLKRTKYAKSLALQN